MHSSGSKTAMVVDISPRKILSTAANGIIIEFQEKFIIMINTDADMFAN
jgi:hypothetical protein